MLMPQARDELIRNERYHIAAPDEKAPDNGQRPRTLPENDFVMAPDGDDGPVSPVTPMRQTKMR